MEKKIKSFLNRVNKAIPEINFSVMSFGASKYYENNFGGALYYRHEKSQFNGMRFEIKFSASYRDDGSVRSSEGFISDYGYLHNNRMPTTKEFVEWVKKSPNYSEMIAYMK